MSKINEVKSEKIIETESPHRRGVQKVFLKEKGTAGWKEIKNTTV